MTGRESLPYDFFDFLDLEREKAIRTSGRPNSLRGLVTHVLVGAASRLLRLANRTVYYGAFHVRHTANCAYVVGEGPVESVRRDLMWAQSRLKRIEEDRAPTRAMIAALEAELLKRGNRA
jgi:hypothetical protein